MSLLLTEYLPDPADLDAAAVIETRKRLQAYLQQFWPELDTRPNSVFGDIYLTPMATLMTAAEIAVQRFKSDLDLANVAQGVVYDVDFVTAFLKNFGISTEGAINASGTIRLVFNVDQEYVIESSTTFTFGSAVFFINPEEGNPIYIKPTTEPNARRVLTKTGVDQYEVYLPVMGTPGAQINDGDAAVISVPIDTLVSINAVGKIDPGKPEETIVTLAAKAQRQFAAATLASRSGIISFCSARWPGLLALSATVTGDREMLRSGQNPLGIYEGAVDVFVKSSDTFSEGEAIVPLTYDIERQAWVGRLTLPVVPAFYNLAAGIFQTNDFQSSRGVNQIFAKSSHPTVRGVGVAYSRYEILGVAITDTNPVDFTPAYTGPITALTTTSVNLAVRGEYNGDLFNQYGSRSVRIRLDSVTTVDGLPAVQANVRDAVSGEVVSVFFVGDNDVTPTKGVIHKADAGYRTMFGGMDLELIPPSSSFVPADMVGLEFEFAYAGRVANFSVNYLYDPFLVQVDNVLRDPNHKPVNADPMARNFVTCHITQFTINYRTRYGQVVDVSAATEAIVSYLNSLGYPNQYEDSVVAAIMTNYGASGIQSITKKGYFYPSLAAAYVEDDGTEVTIPRVETTTLLPGTNDLGFGPRNVGYLVDRDTLVFNGTAY